eukprot:CAMPEP_0196720530 /NCGR_PEP_ID=MMETSP1091-20130531/3316_1 /TAXON_ID=302021 /ORGANISM="Rhodomonas sp., Strain CCMP768" /LENGTH=249 /DNA_ID=CAMNT_0042061801 /DNA_START=19 /DNA_END=768 /DNA_ORIENTATION=+
MNGHRAILPFLLLATSNAFCPSLNVISNSQRVSPLSLRAIRGIHHVQMVRSEEQQDTKTLLRKDVEEVFSKPGFAKPSIENDSFDPIANSGKKEVKDLGDLTISETEELKKKLMEEIDLAMKGAEFEMLEEYDKKTQEILDSMKRDRDIIRKETETIQKFKEEMDASPLWWARRGKQPKKKGSAALSVALVLAWTFGLAALNELYTGVNSDEGLSVIGGCKAAADGVLAVVSAKIASKKPSAASEDTEE